MKTLAVPRRTLTLALRHLQSARRRRLRILGRLRPRPVLRPQRAAPLKLRYRMAAPSARRKPGPVAISRAPIAVAVLHRIERLPSIASPAVRAAAVPRSESPRRIGALQPSAAVRQASPARASAPAADRQMPAGTPWHGVRPVSLGATRSHADAFAPVGGPASVLHTPGLLARQRGATAAQTPAAATSQRQPIKPVARTGAGASHYPSVARRNLALAYPALELRPMAPPSAARTASRPSPEIELVWRQPPPAASKPSDAPQVLPHSAVAAPTPRTAAGKHLAATLDNPGPFRLDPKTAERLADEVIKRVERQLRIERERRGL